MKAKANRNSVQPRAAAPAQRGGKARQYLAGRDPIRVPVSPELGEEIEQKTEWYRLDKRAQKTAYIKHLSRKIIEAFHPEKIILFGSRAYGKPREDSDIDMLVVMSYEGDSAMTAVQILNHLDVLAPIDLLVRSPKEIRHRIKIGDDFMREIVERGKVMYEADHGRVGKKG